MKQKLLTGPYLLWMAIFVIIPMFLIGYYAFTRDMGGSMRINHGVRTTIFEIRAFSREVLEEPDAARIEERAAGILSGAGAASGVANLRPFAYKIQELITDIEQITNIVEIDDIETQEALAALQIMADGLIITAEEARDVVFNVDGFRHVFTPGYLSVLWRSVWVAALATLICLLLGYPIAYILASREFSMKTTLMLLFALPMWMNYLLRTYAWMSILERNGILNTVLGAFGLPPVNMLFTYQAVILGMVYNFLPFMILPIRTSLDRIDYSLIESAQDLGANPFTVFRRVVLPLSIPGVISGITMVFMPSATTFIIPQLLGGGQFLMVGNLIENQFLTAGDWNLGSALSLILLVVILFSMVLINKVDKKSSEGGTLM